MYAKRVAAPYQHGKLRPPNRAIVEDSNLIIDVDLHVNPGTIWLVRCCWS